uniref:Enolase n=2 Tax=Timema TaxID=61471 RepID=A0A7R9PR18_TIMGE|nr:unnamed protein product [Timema genevievae]
MSSSIRGQEHATSSWVTNYRPQLDQHFQERSPLVHVPATATSGELHYVLLTIKMKFSTKAVSRFAEKMPLQKIFARQIFDSRGNPTVEVDLVTDLGLFRAAVPSGASTGIYEALELRDNKKEHYHGKGVQTAIDNINNIITPELLKQVRWELGHVYILPELLKQVRWELGCVYILPELLKQTFEATQQEEIDDFLLKLDGTENKSKFGANAILGVSLAVCKAGGCQERCTPLQVSGGFFHLRLTCSSHIADLAKNPNIILPVPAFNVINGGSHAGNKLAMQEFMIFPSGAKSFTEAMKMGSEVYHHLMKVIKAKFGLDATSVGDEGGFAPNILNNKDALNLIVDAIEKAGYSGKIEIGMDVAASEFYRDGKYDLDFKNPNSDKSAFLSPQQLQELYLEFIKEFPMVSIEDPFDQDDWAAWSSITASTKIQIKTGAPCRSERLAKYNQILRIEEELGAKARYAGKNFRNPV